MDEKEKEGLEQEEGLTLRDIFFIIRKHLIAIICILICFTALGYGYSKMQPKEYRSSGSFMVSLRDDDTNKNGTAITTKYQFSTYISKTFVAFLSKDVVLEVASEDLKNANDMPIAISPSAIRSGMSASLQGDTLIIEVSFVSTDPEVSRRVVESLMKAAIQVSNETEEGKDGKEQPKYLLLCNSLSILDKARPATYLSHTMRNMVIFFAIGLVVATAYVSLRQIFDTSFKSKTELEHTLGIPVLASIPSYTFKDEKEDK